MVVLADGAYCGIAPVPGGRVNVGIVLAGSAWRRPPGGGRRRGDGRARARGDPAARRASRRRGGRAGPPTRSRAPARSAAASRAAPGPAGWWSATPPGSSTRSPGRASTGRWSRRGSRRRRSTHSLPAATRPTTSRPTTARCARRFASKDVVSRLVLAFLARPPLFEQRRAAARRRDDIRATMGLVMGDLVPASRALDPRFLAGLLGRDVTPRLRPGRRRPADPARGLRLVRGRTTPSCCAGSRADDAGAGRVDAPRRRPRLRRGPGGRRPARAARGDRPRRPRRRPARRPVGGPRARRDRRAATGSTSSASSIASTIDRRRAARRGRRLHRPRRVDPVRPARRRCASSTSSTLGPRTGGPLSALDDRDRRRRAARARLPARPRRHPLGAAAPPLRAVARSIRREADGALVCDFVARRVVVPWLGLGIPVAWRSRTWHEPGDPAAALPSTSRARRRAWT